MAAGYHKHGTTKDRSGICSHAVSEADAHTSEAESAPSTKGLIDASSVRDGELSLYLDEARDVYYRVNQNRPRSLNGRYGSKQQVPPEPVRFQMMNPRTPRYTRRNQKSVDIEEVKDAGTGWRKPSAKVYTISISRATCGCMDEGSLSKGRLTA